jgi:hypothetical protein
MSCGISAGSQAPNEAVRYLDHATSTCCGDLEFAKDLRGFLASNEVEEIPPDVKAYLERFVQELWRTGGQGPHAPG